MNIINNTNTLNYYCLSNGKERYLNLLEDLNKKINEGEDFVVQQLKTGEFKVLLASEHKRIDKKIYRLYFKKLHHKRALKNIIALSYHHAIQNPELFSQFPIYASLFDKIYDNLNPGMRDNPLKFKKIILQSFSKDMPSKEVLFKNAKVAVNKFFNMSMEKEFSHLFGVSIASTLGLSHNPFLRGGMPIFTTRQELELVQSFLKKYAFNETEKNLLETYFDDLNRSFDLNQILYKLDSTEIDANFLKAAELIYVTAQQLKQNESLYLDTSISDHAMRLKIKRGAVGFELTLFDTSGYLEFFHSPNAKSALDFIAFGKGHTALEAKVTNRNMENHGKFFFLELLKFVSNSEEKNSSGQHKEFIDVYKSFSYDYKTTNREVTQKTGNCFAQRVKSCQKKCFGPRLYKKFRYHTIESVKNDFLFMASGKMQAELYEELKALEIKQLSKNELRKVKQKIAALKTVPSNFEEWKPVFQALNHNLAKQAA